MKKMILLVALAVATLSTGCMTYRHKNEILNETSMQATARKSSEHYRLVEFRFRSDLDADIAAGREQVVDGKAYTEWLAKEFPSVFSTSSGAIPVVVRQTMISPGEVKKYVTESQNPGMRGLDYGLHPSVFDIIFTQITLGIWPATLSYDYKFETEIQLSNEIYAEPFVWKTHYSDHVANSLVAWMYYPSSRGYETGKLENSQAKLRTFNQLHRTSISRKSSEAERQAAKTEMLWFGGFQNSPETMKRGAALGIIGALDKLTPEQRQAVRRNPVARYLAEKADATQVP